MRHLLLVADASSKHSPAADAGLTAESEHLHATNEDKAICL